MEGHWEFQGVKGLSLLTLCLIDHIMAKYLSCLLLNLWMKSLWYYHSNETPLAKLLQSAIHFLGFYKEEFKCFWLFVFTVSIETVTLCSHEMLCP